MSVRCRKGRRRRWPSYRLSSFSSTPHFSLFCLFTAWNTISSLFFIITINHNKAQCIFSDSPTYTWRSLDYELESSYLLNIPTRWASRWALTEQRLTVDIFRLCGRWWLQRNIPGLCRRLMDHAWKISRGSSQVRTMIDWMLHSSYFKPFCCCLFVLINDRIWKRISTQFPAFTSS